MKKYFSILSLVLLALAGSMGAARAQCARLIQNGTVQNGNPVVWIAPCVLSAAGSSAGSYSGSGGVPMITNLGIQGPLGILNGPTNEPYNWGLFDWSTTTAGEFDINLSGVGGAPSASLAFILNGIKYAFPGPGNGNVIGPSSPIPTANDVVVWNGGLAVKDGGGPPALAPVTTPIVGDATCWGATTLTDCGAPPLLTVSTVAEMQALPAALLSGSLIQLTGYYGAPALFHAPSVNYVLAHSSCSLNTGLGDGGSQIPSNTAGYCYELTAQGFYRTANWGAVNSTIITNGTASSSSKNMTLDAVGDFANLEPVSIFGAGPAFSLNQPTSVTVMTDGTSGSTKWCAVILPIDAGSGWGNQSLEECNGSDGAATLYGPDGSNPYAGEIIAWTAPTGTAPSAYAVYFGPQGEETCFTTTINTTLEAYGPGPGPGKTQSKVPYCPAWLPLNPPGSGNNQADVQPGNTIASGAGTTAITLGTAVASPLGDLYASASGSGYTNIILHESGPAVNNALASGFPIQGGIGTQMTTQPIVLSETNGQAFMGCSRECYRLMGWGTGFNVLSSTNAISYDQKIMDMTVDCAQMSSGFCLYLNEAPNFDIENIDLTCSYDMWEIVGGSANGTANHVTGTNQIPGEGCPSEVRGDLGIAIISTDMLNTGIQRLAQITIPKMFQGINVDLDGLVPTLYFDNWTIGEGPAETVIRNTVGASSPPQYVKFSNTGWNGCWGNGADSGIAYGCMDDRDGVDVELYNPYMQDYANGASNTNDNTVLVGGPAMTFNQVSGQEFGGYNSILDARGSNVISNGTWLHGASGPTTAAAICESGAGLILSGSDLTSNAVTTSFAYGVRFGSGCNGSNSVTGSIIGNILDVQDLTDVAGAVRVSWLPPGTNFTAETSGSAINPITASVFCSGYQGTAAFVQRSGPSTAISDTSPTAASCLTTLGTVNQNNFYVRLKNTIGPGHAWTIQSNSNFTFTGDAVTASNIVIPYNQTASCFGSVVSGPTGTLFCTLLR